MISTAEALSRILGLIDPMPAEDVALASAAGRVLARNVAARRSQPPFAAAAMDGYAVRQTEAVLGARLHVAGEAMAGRRYAGKLGPGEAVRIFTGAPVPEGADAILIQEDAEREGESVIPRVALGQGQHIRPAGGDFRKGEVVSAPRRIDPHLIALLASMNIAELPVARKPRIALIPTGDELVWPGQEPGLDQIVSSNNLGLAALLNAQGAEPRLLPIARDNARALEAALDLARGCDMIVTLGGASVGEHDLVQEVFTARGLNLDFWRIAMRPGKPLMAGKIGGVPMLGLPGNPVSAMVCGHLFLRPAIDRALGLPAGPLPRRTGILGKDLPANGPREHFMRARLVEGRIQPFERQDSSLLSVLEAADLLLVRPPHAPEIGAGSEVEFMDFNL